MIAIEDIERRSTPEPNTGCLLWLGPLNRPNGYGQILINGRLQSVHRVAWSAANGMPVPVGLLVMHRCDQPSCANPRHLLIGTVADNNTDKARKGRATRGERNNTTKLTASAVVQIRARRANGESPCALAAAFHVSRPTISHIALRNTWKHVP